MRFRRGEERRREVGREWSGKEAAEVGGDAHEERQRVGRRHRRRLELADEVAAVAERPPLLIDLLARRIVKPGEEDEIPGAEEEKDWSAFSRQRSTSIEQRIEDGREDQDRATVIVGPGLDVGVS
jgi:hypothetical protein